VTQSTLALVLLSLLLGAGAWFAFLWAERSGEFEDLEGPKHRMLEEDEVPGPPPEERG
jgi:cbb3-type cytochrome oxidase maturation protein